MAGVAAEDSEVGRSAEMVSNEQLSGEALAEWRSSEQVENGTPSTSPPYWDCDDEEDGGPKPSELFGKYTWKIDKFSQIKRELRSNAFEIGGYQWYILIYPQGCDVCNHLSLFLCVANHDKLLPGWSHFAQFTIAVVNKDPKKSKYSDTLHRFWKKEHDWGWKKFMELSKVFDGFIESDTLIIKAQVQVIREKADRPFRCLDRQYRRELVRVYLSNVEQICRRFVEERRGKLRKLIEDRVRWSSFSAFWLGIDQNSRRRMAREKIDVILKVTVKHFFIEKEVTSTLVMDSLYSGLKALEAQNNNKNARATVLDLVETTAPIVRVEKDTFVLVDDIVVLLGRAAVEPLPPKDEKGPQNRKDGNTGEDFNKDSIERDERRLTELGRRTLEMFVLAHIFSNKIEVAYQEAVALRRQEELIREEEAAWLAESEQKAKRGKDKKSKKKQAKQKRNNRKGKEKGKEENLGATQQNKHQINGIQEDNDLSIEQKHSVLEKRDMPDSVSEASDSVATEVLRPETDRDASPVNWDTDTSEVHPPTESRSRASSLSSVQSGIAEKKNPSTVDDSSSTCSTDSIPSVVMNGPSKGNILSNHNISKSHSRGKARRGKMIYGGSSSTYGINSNPSGRPTDSRDLNGVSGSNKAAEAESKSLASQDDGKKCLELNTVKKEVASLQKILMVKDQVDVERHHNGSSAIPSSQSGGSLSNLPSSVQPKTEYMTTAVLDPVAIRNASQSSLHQTDKSASPAMSSQVRYMSKPEIQKAAPPKSVEKAMAEAAPVISRPSSAPLVPAPKPVPPTTMMSMVQTAPSLARSVSAAGRLGPDPSLSNHNNIFQSYRNAIIGNTVASSSASHPSSSTSGKSSAPLYSSSCSVSAPTLVNHNSERIDPNSVKPGSPFSISSKRTDQNLVNSGFPFSMLTHENPQNGPRWYDNSQRNASRSIYPGQSVSSEVQDLDMYSNVNSGSHQNVTEFLAGTSGRQIQGALVDEFPHLDIINDLLDDEHADAADNSAREDTMFRSHNSLAQFFNRQYSYPGEIGTLGDVGPSSNTRRVETHSYHDDGFQREYPSFARGLFDTQDFVPQVGPLTYANGQIDGRLQNHWHMAGSDASLFDMRNMEADIYPQYNPDYSTLSCGVNGYPVFPPSSRR